MGDDRSEPGNGKAPPSGPPDSTPRAPAATLPRVMPAAGSTPHISVVTPVKNEEAILYDPISGLREKFGEKGWSYEIIVAENGSRARPVEIGTDMAPRHDDVQFFSLG